ncbi:50S ribosomal protein L11 methyltransferase [Prevotella sp. OH937_COT-195]|uniref:50S ribosomal protein L11 methyltransferase n=1 Tax=Prevotella sp. OH937_COT-195 TaxID=2491051 RepID=UPI000F65604E|nr:50S ribosomal protein L11 methyltransferase [Prevotella sp. OH937_COT-195]RRC97484.1 50S ribosomal protein L11 methyltransferase [Prevotella sp. OH937_COT-195]
MKYTEVVFEFYDDNKIRIEDPHLLTTARDITASLAGAVGFDSFVETDNGMKGYILEEMFHKDTLDECIADFPIDNISIEYSYGEAENKNWNETWENGGFDPINIDNKCIIHDISNTHDIPADIMDIAIDAKQAFGTGNHETTRMIVSTMLGMEMRGKRLLDCGCGTGILSIVAAKNGADQVTAYDIDEWSVENTAHNAKLNGVGGKIETLLGDANVLTHVSGVFDIITANINRNTLIADMPKFKEVLASGGVMILSGFYENDIKMLTDEACKLGLDCEEKNTDNGWAMIVLR